MLRADLEIIQENRTGILTRGQFQQRLPGLQHHVLRFAVEGQPQRAFRALHLARQRPLDPQGGALAQIAAEHLQPGTRAAVAALLDGEPEPSLAGIANWADEVREPRDGPLHYLNFPDGDCRYQPQRDCPRGRCVIAPSSATPHASSSDSLGAAYAELAAAVEEAGAGASVIAFGACASLVEDPEVVRWVAASAAAEREGRDVNLAIMEASRG